MEQEVYNHVKTNIKQILNIDLGYYKDEQMKRRLDSWLARSTYPNWREYFQALSRNSAEVTRLRDYLTINVTEFFRDPERWELLRQKLLPDLLRDAAARSAGLRVWSAGCSTGVEPYTLSILMDECAPKLPCSILATDLDKGALQKARARGPYREEEARNLTPEQRQKYLDRVNGQVFAKAFLAERIRFDEQDLNTARFGTGFDLIVCRNVIIYFTNEAKLNLYRKLYAALRPGGVLFLGGTEIIPTPKEIGFRHIGYSFYVREAKGSER